jgi:hypothetical protein
LISECDSKYSGTFGEIFRSELIRILQAAIRANAIERFVRPSAPSVSTGC